jgi:hypothetical protein
MGFSGFCVGWIEIESSAMERDRGFEVRDVPEAAGGLLHPLDRRVEGVHARIGDAMLHIGEHVSGGGAEAAWRPPPSEPGDYEWPARTSG